MSSILSFNQYKNHKRSQISHSGPLSMDCGMFWPVNGAPRRLTCVLHTSQYCLILPGCSLRSVRHCRHSRWARLPQMKHSRGAGSGRRDSLRWLHASANCTFKNQTLCEFWPVCPLLTFVYKVSDVKLRGGNDMRKHLVLASKSGHLNYEAGRNLRTNYKKK